MSRASGAVVLAVTLVLAGCSGFAGDDTASHSRVTPVSVQAIDERQDRFVAPGVTRRQVVDPGALQRAHGERLANVSHTYRERVTRRYANGTLRGRDTTVVRRNGSAVRYRYVRRLATGTTVRRVDTWAVGRRVYTARTVGNETTYSATNVSAGSRRVPLGTADYAASLGRVFRLFTLTVDGAVRRDGRQVYRLVSADDDGVPALRNATFVGYVSPRGVVTAYRIRYRVRRDGAPVIVTVNVTVDDLGTTTVERPAWYPRAAKQGPSLSS